MGERDVGRGCSRPRLVVALDFPGAEAALDLASRLDPRRCRLKVGKELFVRAGPDVVARLQRAGFEVFLDLKFHDIPHTVARACRAAAELGVWMLNVHASGGRRMLEAARAAIGVHEARPVLIAVTVLTSLERADMAELGCEHSPQQLVVRLADLARSCGLDGVVCSARDLTGLQRVVPDTFLRVTPGIRPGGDPAADQRRVTTPAEALAAGATHLVVGRPITGAPDPMKALERIEEEMGEEQVTRDS